MATIPGVLADVKMLRSCGLFRILSTKSFLEYLP